MKKYFIDKIDWRFLNYLIDKSTEFEDNGSFFDIYIRVSDYAIIYNTKGGFFQISEYKIEQFQENGLVYIIAIYLNNSTSEIDKLTLHKYMNNIQNKCNRLEMDKVSGIKILATPKK